MKNSNILLVLLFGAGALYLMAKPKTGATPPASLPPSPASNPPAGNNGGTAPIVTSSNQTITQEQQMQLSNNYWQNQFQQWAAAGYDPFNGVRLDFNLPVF